MCRSESLTLRLAGCVFLLQQFLRRFHFSLSCSGLQVFFLYLMDVFLRFHCASSHHKILFIFVDAFAQRGKIISFFFLQYQVKVAQSGSFSLNGLYFSSWMAHNVWCS